MPALDGCPGGLDLLHPAAVGSLGLNVVKTLRDGANYVRLAMHSLYLFDAERSGFKRLIANTQGFEVIM